MARDALHTLTTLAILREVRDRKVDAASMALARAVAAKGAAAQARCGAEEAREGHASRVALALEGERAALGRGALRAEDLAVEAAWRRRVARERDELTAAVGRAKELEDGAARDERAARVALAAHKTDAEVVSALLSRREAERRKRAEARAEEAVAEARRPRR